MENNQFEWFFEISLKIADCQLNPVYQKEAATLAAMNKFIKKIKERKTLWILNGTSFLKNKHFKITTVFKTPRNLLDPLHFEKNFRIITEISRIQMKPGLLIKKK